jgi:CO/xanthine dehydrogenase FAD-binding subunit
MRGPRLYFRPKRLEQATQILGAQPVQILAGGTDFFPALGERAVLGPVLDLSDLSVLKGIQREPEWIRIGGLTTWSEIIAADLPPCFDALKAAAREIGGVQIQNRGTIAGNLCNASPAADGVPPLLALDAQVELVSAASLRRMPVSEFIVGNRKTLRRSDEILASVIVSRNLQNATSGFLKLGARRYLVISIVMVAAVLKLDGAQISDVRIAVGSCSTKARRLADLERDLMGVSTQDIKSVLSPEHVACLAPISDVRATAEYRWDAALILISRVLGDCVGRT